jgi:hypothetical protein
LQLQGLIPNSSVVHSVVQLLHRWVYRIPLFFRKEANELSRDSFLSLKMCPTITPVSSEKSEKSQFTIVELRTSRIKIYSFAATTSFYIPYLYKYANLILLVCMLHECIL